jgi:hypothetical protein
MSVDITAQIRNHVWKTSNQILEVVGGFLAKKAGAGKKSTVIIKGFEKC